MVTNFDYLEKWLSDMKVNNFQVWKIDKQGTVNRNNGYCFASKDGAQNAIENFREWCENNTGSYLLQQFDGNSNNAEIEFSLPFRPKRQDPVQQQPQVQPYIGFTDSEHYYTKREFEIMMENERLKNKVERLEEQVKELKENSSASGEFFKTITPFVGPVVQGFLNKQTAGTQIAGLAAAEETTESEGFDIPEADFKQLTEDLKRWSAKDPEYLKVIHKLSLFVENPMYLTAKGMLFNQE